MSSQFLAITGVFVIIFNLVMWIVFAVKFKKIFSTEDTITEVRNNINELEKSLYQNFTRVIDIADDKIKKLKSVSAEAERRIQEYKMLVSSDAENAFSETIEKTVSRSRSKSAKKEKEQVSQAELPLLSKNSPLKSKPVSPYAASYEKHRGDEFFSLTQKAKDEFSKPEIPVTKVPVVQPEFFTAANPVESRKSFRTKVMELKKKGLDDEEIAAALKRSIQEVKFSLELS